MDTFEKKVKIILAKKGWSLKDLSDKLGYKDQGALTSILKRDGGKKVSEIAKLLGVSMYELTGEPEPLEKSTVEEMKAYFEQEYKARINALEADRARLLNIVENLTSHKGAMAGKAKVYPIPMPVGQETMSQAA